MKRTRPRIALACGASALGGIMLLLTVVAGAGASGTTTLNSGSGSTTVGGATGTMVFAQLDAADVGLDGFDITINFDKTVVTAASITIAADWSDANVAGEGIDNATGTVRVVAIKPSGTADCPALCPLFTINWTGVADGITQVQLVNRPNFPPLANGGTAVTFSFHGGTVTVGDGGGGENSPTPTNTTESGGGGDGSPTATNTATATATATGSPTATMTATPTRTPVGSFRAWGPMAADDGINP